MFLPKYWPADHPLTSDVEGDRTERPLRFVRCYAISPPDPRMVYVTFMPGSLGDCVYLFDGFLLLCKSLIYTIECVVDRTINFNLQIISNEPRTLQVTAIVSMKEVIQRQQYRIAEGVPVTLILKYEPRTDALFHVEFNDYGFTVFSSSSRRSTVSAGLAIHAVVDARRA
mgnify:CR=1 FL=1|jgi:hypothetical protein